MAHVGRGDSLVLLELEKLTRIFQTNCVTRLFWARAYVLLRVHEPTKSQRSGCTTTHPQQSVCDFSLIALVSYLACLFVTGVSGKTYDCLIKK